MLDVLKPHLKLMSLTQVFVCAGVPVEGAAFTVPVTVLTLSDYGDTGSFPHLSIILGDLVTGVCLCKYRSRRQNIYSPSTCILTDRRLSVQVYKQKVKHLLYEHQNSVSTLKADAELGLKLAGEEAAKRESQLQKDCRNLKLELKEQVRSS